MSLVRGQKLKLSALTPMTDIEAAVMCSFQGSIDITCFGVDGNGMLSDDRYFIFYNQPASPQQEIIKQDLRLRNEEHFSLFLSKLPPNIQRLVFTAAIDGSGSMANIGNSFFTISAQGREVARYDFNGSSFSAEKAIIIAELYLKGEWRLGIVGQGFNGGLSALLKHYGGQEADPAPAQQYPQNQGYQQQYPQNQGYQQQYPQNQGYQQQYPQNQGYQQQYPQNQGYQQNQRNQAPQYSQNQSYQPVNPQDSQNFTNRFQPTGNPDRSVSGAGHLDMITQMSAYSMAGYHPFMMHPLCMTTLSCPPQLSMVSTEDPNASSSIIDSASGVLGGFNRSYGLSSEQYGESHSLADRICTASADF